MLAWPLFLVYLGLAVAFLIRLVAPSAYVFATVSNLAYGMAGLACTPALQTPERREAGAKRRAARCRCSSSARPRRHTTRARAADWARTTWTSSSAGGSWCTSRTPPWPWFPVKF